MARPTLPGPRRLRRPWAGLVVAVAVAGCGGHARMVPKTGRAIGQVELVDARSVDRGDVLGGLGLIYARDQGQPFGRFLVAQDERRIASYYVRRGFFAASVTSTVTTTATRADVTFTVVEGARARLVRVDVVGLPPDARVSAAALRAQVPLADGAPFDYTAYDEATPRLPEVLRAAGYARAKVDGVVLADRARAEAVIRLTVTLGPLAHFGQVELRDVPAGLEEAVAARVEFAPGEPYRPAALETTRTALYGLGRFALVRVEPDRDEDDVVDVTITVAEAPRHDLRLGGGVGLNPLALELRGLAQYGVAAWPWPLTTTRLELRPALVIHRDDRTRSPRVDAVATLDRLDLIRPRYSGAIEGGFSYLEVEAYASYGPRARLSVRSPSYADVVQASVGWQLGLTAYTNLAAVLDDALIARLGLDGVDRIGAFDQSVVVDLRDDRLAPRRGAYLEVRAEEGTVAAGGALTYLRLIPDLRGYVSLGSVTAAARVRAGVLTGDGPVTRRFFGGGANGYRGLPERQLAPFAGVGSAQVPYGGTGLLEVSGELRFPLPRLPYDLAGVAFLDGGDVPDDWAAIALDHLHWAAGLGLRLPTLIGAVRLDVAYRLTRTGAGEPRPGERWTFHLSVGEAF
ncbi:MAG: BamA/TamA family outer membrane protein [Myxococcales bacterium]|nr:BamA/TamA family outer membrane protein [Myxococcales bacterium]